MPLTPAAVYAAQQPPDMAELRIPASEIDHPILQSVELNPDEGLSPDSAAVLAVLLNPSLRTIRDQKDLLSAQLLDAGLLPNPELIYTLGVPTAGPTAGRVTAYGLGVSWDVTSLISQAAKNGAAGAQNEALALDVGWQEWQVAQAAKTAVYQLVSLQNRIPLAEEASRGLSRTVAQIQKAVADGSMTSAALNAARTESRRADENLLDLEQQADRLRLQLKQLLGVPPDSPISLSPDIDLPDPVEPPAGPTLLEGLEQRRLDLLALRRGYDSQEESVRVAILDQFPKINLGPTISRDTDSIQTTGFALGIELPFFNRKQGKIALERATRQKLFDEYMNRVFAARSDIELILSGIHFTNAQISVARAAETDLKELLESYRPALADGRIDALTYSTAENDLAAARMKVFALKGQLAQAVVALELAAGFYEIPGSGRLPVTAPTAPKEGETP